jgi:hypothetical protein
METADHSPAIRAPNRTRNISLLLTNLVLYQVLGLTSTLARIVLPHQATHVGRPGEGPLIADSATGSHRT